MPEVIDWTFNYNTSTTATTIDCPRPQCQGGDLLLAILSTDTGTQTWSCSGWTQLFSVTNTSNLAVMYKIAGSSEPDNYTFTYTTAETANAAILSIRDVDTSSPIANYATANRTAARQNMPTTTATRNNSLIVYCGCHGSTAVIPSIIEGPVFQLCAKDGSAHSDHISWGFQVSSGSTPSNIVSNVTGTTYNGVLATVVVNPPSTGATRIPAYTASDNSIFVDPIHGTTAYNGNTAFAGTATTYWTSPLASRTLANATASAKTDYGINTYRSCGGMTGPTTANTYQGATLVLADANRVNVTGKNVLVHAMPLVPADIQTVYDTALGKGIEVGMASSADNGMVWHVHGAFTPWGVKRVPIIINEQNTSGVIDTRGTFDKTLTKIFGFFTCGYLVSSDWTWTMIWISDTTVVAGGCSTRPVTLEDIVKTVADGHERISALLQGKNQALFVQPIQIGNGGTNPVYLKLESTAIEFPEIYNLAARQTYYCSVPNYSGITYYAGANDTIIHRNSVISSSSKYHWKIHSSSSTSATYDFSGLVIINAGTVQLVANIPIHGVTFQQCDEISASGASIENCTFKSGTSTVALTVNSVSEMNNIKNCQFQNNTRAIKITSAGTYTFDNLKFSGNTYDIENASSGLVTINCINGSNPTTYINTGGGTTVINNAVTLTVRHVKTGNEPSEYVRVAIYKKSDMTEIMNKDATETDELNSGYYKASTTYNYTGDTTVIIRAREKGWLPFEAEATITSNGLDVSAVWLPDPNYNP